ncbi:oxidoreductase [Rapidithrix thailandica]|uniref:Oxidoreductase n=1 Tax=Rapidithrix thailandica TaxID=413964 RepID=A0AAW9RZP1_9BACT
MSDTKEITSKVALVAGATGLIGHTLVKALLKQESYRQVIALVRRPLGIENDKLKEINVDFDTLGNLPPEVIVDTAFCCLGTTMKKAGSKEKFYKVDCTYVQYFAEYALRAGAKHFHLVSALGSNKTSMFFYNRVKGEAEEFVRKMPFDKILIYRPSLLLGERQEARLGEGFAKMFNQLFSFLIPLRYRGIHADTVVAAMLQSEKVAFGPTLQLLESEELQTFH